MYLIKRMLKKLSDIAAICVCLPVIVIILLIAWQLGWKDAEADTEERQPWKVTGW